MIRPSKNDITLGFGATTSPYSPGDPHIGTDYGPEPDNTVYAPEAGRVTLVHWDEKMGNAVHIWVDNRHHALCHMAEFYVTNGDQIKEGQPLGTMGYTGYVVPDGPDGTHLHHAVTVDGVLVDSLSLIEGDEMIETDDQARDVFVLAFHEDAANITQDAINSIKGQPYKTVMPALRTNAKWVEQNNMLVAYPEMEKQLQNQTNGGFVEVAKASQALYVKK